MKGGVYRMLTLMYKLFDGIFPTVADVTRFLKEFDRLNNLKTV